MSSEQKPCRRYFPHPVNSLLVTSAILSLRLSTSAFLNMESVDHRNIPVSFLAAKRNFLNWRQWQVLWLAAESVCVGSIPIDIGCPASHEQGLHAPHKLYKVGTEVTQALSLLSNCAGCTRLLLIDLTRNVTLSEVAVRCKLVTVIVCFVTARR